MGRLWFSWRTLQEVWDWEFFLANELDNPRKSCSWKWDPARTCMFPDMGYSMGQWPSKNILARVSALIYINYYPEIYVLDVAQLQFCNSGNPTPRKVLRMHTSTRETELGSLSTWGLCFWKPKNLDLIQLPGVSLSFFKYCILNLRHTTETLCVCLFIWRM